MNKKGSKLCGHDEIHPRKRIGCKTTGDTNIRKNESRNKIGSIVGNASTKHLIVVLKTWMKTQELKEKQKYSNGSTWRKEGLIDTLHTMYTSGH